MNPLEFTGKVALVTGASSGMGLAAAHAFGEAGAAVALVDLNADAAQAAADDLSAAGHQVLALTCDVANEDQVAATIAQTVAAFGRLDAAFNNAGIQIAYAGIAEEEAGDVDRLNGLNYRGIWASMKHELRRMCSQGSGAIVNCSSIGGLIGGAGRAAYHPSKHAVIGLTKSAAKEYGSHGVRINTISPGTIDTPMVAHMVAAGALSHDLAVEAIPSAGSAAPTRSRPPCSGCAVPAPASLPASPSSSTVASSPSSLRLSDPAPAEHRAVVAERRMRPARRLLLREI